MGSSPIMTLFVSSDEHGGDWNTMRMSNLQAPVTHDFVLSPLTPPSWGDDAPYKKYSYLDIGYFYKSGKLKRFSVSPSHSFYLTVWWSVYLLTLAMPGAWVTPVWRGDIRHQTQPHMWHAVLTRGLTCHTGHGYYVLRKHKHRGKHCGWEWGPDTRPPVWRQCEGCDHVGVRSEESWPQCPQAILIFVFCA